MKLIANTLNGNYLQNILPSIDDNVDGVLAAIAYGNDINEKFIKNCIENRHRLDIWMRYDHTVPVAVPLLKKLLRHHKDNVFCKLIPDYLHSKVIWWQGFGAYIGSANLTDRAWMTNIEAGLFLTDDNLHENGLIIELEQFFGGLRELDKAFNLTQEVVEEMEAIDAKRKDLYKLGIELRKTPVWEGPAYSAKEKAKDRQKESFRQEWHDTLTILRSIGEQLADNRPVWVNEDVPVEWQIDQFLHAYYYNKVGTGNSKPVEDYYQSNKHNPQSILLSTINWWKATTDAPSNEDDSLYESAPYIREHLSKDKILSVTEEELTKICFYTHATKDHVIKMKLSTLGRPDLKSLGRPERLPLYAKWLLKQRNSKGWSVLELLKYVLYEGEDKDLWERLFTAARNPDYTIPHYGLNSIAEIVGWARPEVAPPRNGRTSKAFRALGHDVRIY